MEKENIRPASVGLYCNRRPINGTETNQKEIIVVENVICEQRDIQFNVDYERQTFLKDFLMQIYLLSEFLPEI